jgi:hypothetical protein
MPQISVAAAEEMGVVFYQQPKPATNYADARTEFRLAKEAAFKALQYESKEQVHTALARYWLAQKRFRVARATSVSGLVLPRDPDAPDQLTRLRLSGTGGLTIASGLPPSLTR